MGADWALEGVGAEVADSALAASADAAAEAAQVTAAAVVNSCPWICKDAEVDSAVSAELVDAAGVEEWAAADAAADPVETADPADMDAAAGSAPKWVAEAERGEGVADKWGSVRRAVEAAETPSTAVGSAAAVSAALGVATPADSAASAAEALAAADCRGELCLPESKWCRAVLRLEQDRETSSCLYWLKACLQEA